MLTLLVRNFVRPAAGRRLLSLTPSKAPLDPLQEESLNENCILVDPNDKVIGKASKRDCHTVQSQNVQSCGSLLLHRAFSVYLFNTQGDLLLQKRSPEKITFPNVYTNSCCSHPLADIPGEYEERDALGVKRAAQRRLNIELGIPEDQVALDDLKYITRIIYKDEGDGKWGEYEIDYVLFLKKDLNINPNPNEISEVTYVRRDNFDERLPKLGGLTPWFDLISKHCLRRWWDNLDDLEKVVDHKNIRKLGAIAKE